MPLDNIQFRPLSALGWQVTEEEAAEIAEWCGGIVVLHLENRPGPTIVLPINEQRPRPLHADVGDWIVLMGAVWRVIPHTQFDLVAERLD